LQGWETQGPKLMDDEALDGAPRLIRLKSSVSKAGDRSRRIAMAEEEGLLPADRSALAARCSILSRGPSKRSEENSRDRECFHGLDASRRLARWQRDWRHFSEISLKFPEHLHHRHDLTTRRQLRLLTRSGGTQRKLNNPKVDPDDERSRLQSQRRQFH